MKKNNILVIAFISLICLISACGQVAQSVAKDSLNGDYKGTLTFTMEFSKLNIGINDQRLQEQCFVKVFADSNVPSLGYAILKQDGSCYPAVNINISGFQLSPNGAAFNVLDQQIFDQGESYQITGVSALVDADGKKFDGGIDDQSNLTFSYFGNVPVPLQGTTYLVPCTAIFQGQKQ